MKTFILTDTAKKMHYVVKMLDPATLVIPRGSVELTMRVQVVGYATSLERAQKREIEVR